MGPLVVRRIESDVVDLNEIIIVLRRESQPWRSEYLLRITDMICQPVNRLMRPNPDEIVFAHAKGTLELIPGDPKDIFVDQEFGLYEAQLNFDGGERVLETERTNVCETRISSSKFVLCRY